MNTGRDGAATWPDPVAHVGWQGENVLVQDARRPFGRRIAQQLRVDGLPAVAGMPSERRISAGIDTLGFYSYPLLFYSLFPNVSLAQLRQLGLAGSYLFDHVLCLDAQLDRASRNTGTTLLGVALHRAALEGLYSLFPPGHGFWDHFDRYYEHFCQSVLSDEVKHRNLVHRYKDDELDSMYSGKAAMAKACLAALCELDGTREMLRSLEASHDAFYVGYQLLDDLLDWRIDYGRKQYSYLLTEGLFHAGWQGRAESDHRPSAAAVGEMLSRSGIAEQVRLLALDYFDKAEHLIGGMPDGSWQAAIRSTRNRVRRLAFESKDAPTSAPTAEPDGEVDDGLRTINWGVVAPISAPWSRWLDPTRGFAIAEPSILDEQRGVSTDAGPSTVGMAVCQVGLAVHASVRALPQFELGAHIGMSAAELEWCRDHDAWLDAMLVCTVDDQALAWTAGREHPRVGSGWVPPAVGRYLGFRLVRDFLSDDPDAADVRAEAVLDHFLRRSVT